MKTGLHIEVVRIITSKVLSWICSGNMSVSSQKLGRPEHHHYKLRPCSLHVFFFFLHIVMKAHVEPCDASISIWCDVFVCNRGHDTHVHPLSSIPSPARPRFHAYDMFIFCSCSQSHDLWYREVKRSMTWCVYWTWFFSIYKKAEKRDVKFKGGVV